MIGRNLDHRTDIFSLGVVLYEALTGLPPFDGDNVNAIMYATVNTMPPPPSNANPGVPTMLDLVVAKALAKNIDERYQTMREFADDLGQVKRLLLARQPGGNVLAKQSPPSTKTPTLEALGIGRYQKDGEVEAEAKPLKLAKAFDSFDATLKLAAMTNQISEFGEYISETQKMRAYQGKNAGEVASEASALSATSTRHATSSATMPPEISGTTSAPGQGRDGAPEHNRFPDLPANILPISMLVLLAALAVGLAIALVLR